MLDRLLPHVLGELSGTWGELMASNGRAAAAAAAAGALTREGAPEAEAEVVAERLLRELTSEHLALLRTLQEVPAPASGKQQIP